MKTEKQLRQLVRQILEEEAINFLKKEKNANTKQLKGSSEAKDLGNPIKTAMNVMDGPTGSDTTSPPVAVKPGVTKSGSEFNAGQHKPIFLEKTEQA